MQVTDPVYLHPVAVGSVCYGAANQVATASCNPCQQGMIAGACCRLGLGFQFVSHGSHRYPTVVHDTSCETQRPEHRFRSSCVPPRDQLTCWCFALFLLHVHGWTCNVQQDICFSRVEECSGHMAC